jgi:hypothetical protein
VDEIGDQLLGRACDVTIVERLGDDIDELVDIIATIDRAGFLPDENAIGVDPVGIGQVLDALSVRGINNIENNIEKNASWVYPRAGNLAAPSKRWNVTSPMDHSCMVRNR